MSRTTILDETIDNFNYETGEVFSTKRSKTIKSKMEPTDEYIKVSRYLNVIFAYNHIPLNLVPISLLFAQRMRFKTNELNLFKKDKQELAEMLDVSFERVRTMISDCRKYDIIRPTETRGIYVVNSYLYSTGSLVETRNLQAHIDFDSDLLITQADQKSVITGEVVRKSVLNREQKGQIPGQIRLSLEMNSGDEDED